MKEVSWRRGSGEESKAREQIKKSGEEALAKIAVLAKRSGSCRCLTPLTCADGMHALGNTGYLLIVPNLSRRTKKGLLGSPSVKQQVLGGHFLWFIRLLQ